MLKFVIFSLFPTIVFAASYVNLSWDPNPEPSVAGYKIYWGATSGSYTGILDVESAVAAAIPLPAGKRYYFAVTAYDTAGLESPFSDEVTTVVPQDMIVPFWYDFRVPGVLYESPDGGSASPYWWLASGGRLLLSNGVGMTIQGRLAPTDKQRLFYSSKLKIQSDDGYHPQNSFIMFLRKRLTNISEEVYFEKKADNLTNAVNRAPWNGFSLLLRYVDENNYYFGSLRADGYATIRKRVNGTYRTLFQKKILSGTYNPLTNANLIPKNVWIGFKMSVNTGASLPPELKIWTDIGRTGTWTLVGVAGDNPSVFGPPLEDEGLVGMRSDFMDLLFDDFRLSLPADMAVQASEPVQGDFYDDPVPDVPVIQMSRSGTGLPLISIIGTPGQSYTLIRSTNLVTWEEVVRLALSPGTSTFQYLDQHAPPHCAFYRVTD